MTLSHIDEKMYRYYQKVIQSSESIRKEKEGNLYFENENNFLGRLRKLLS